MSIQTPFQRLFTSTAHMTATAADTNATEGTGVRFSWPELTLDAPFRHVAETTSTSGPLQAITNAVAFLDYSVIGCLVSLNTTQRRGLWVVLLSTGLVVSAYLSYACVWPLVKHGTRTYVGNVPWMTPHMFRHGGDGNGEGEGGGEAASATDATTAPPSDDASPPSDVGFRRRDGHSPSADVNDGDGTIEGPCPTTSSSTLSMSLPSVFQRALDAVRSHQLTTKAAMATTVLLERQDHQWFATLREHVGAGAAIVGVSLRVPATLRLWPTEEVVTLNRWLEVDIRRAPLSDSPVCLWSNDVGDTYNTDVDSLDANPADAAPCSPDGLHLSALLRDVVGHQFERQRQPLPALQYRVHNQLCTPEHATRYGLEVATLVAGVICGCVLAAPAGESPLATHTSLTSWAASDVVPRCKHEWALYADHRSAAAEAHRTNSPTPPDSPSPVPLSRDETAQSPFAIQSHIAATLWESESDDEEEVCTDTPDACGETLAVAVSSPVRQPIVVCGQLQWMPRKDADDDDMNRNHSPTEWPADAIAQTLVKQLNEVLRPTSPLRPTLHINAEGELYVLSHAPLGLTVKRLLVQACEKHGCTLQLHCLARVYRAGTAARCKVRQTWLSSVELV